jgi:hypothetical protein
VLANAEDKCVVQCQVCALWLGDVEIVALSMWRGVQRQEGVRRVAASVLHRQTKSQGVWVLFVRVLLIVSD